jgi:hypothetical protein
VEIFKYFFDGKVRDLTLVPGGKPLSPGAIGAIRPDRARINLAQWYPPYRLAAKRLRYNNAN